MKARLEIDGVIVDCWTRLLSWFLRAVVWARWLLSQAFQSLSLSGSGPNLATCTLTVPFFFSTALVFFPICIFLLFYLFSVISLCLHPIKHPMSFFLFFLSPALSSYSQASCREQWTGKEQQERGGVQPARVKGESAAG